MTSPPTDQQLTPDREQKIRRNYADSQPDGTVPLLLGEIDRLRTELAQSESIRENADFHLGQEMARRQLAEKETARLRAESAAVAAFLDEQDRAARLFELPTPAWVEAVRAASAPPVAPHAASPAAEAPEVRQEPAGAATGPLKPSLSAEASEACGKCKQPFDSADTSRTGSARFYLTPYCRRCVDLCHDNEIADHRCVICA
jgi:hypothetical protein